MSNERKVVMPEWFDGVVYEKGGLVRNRYTNVPYQLNRYELSMYDFIIGTLIMCSVKKVDKVTLLKADKAVVWFIENNIEAYMALLD